MQRRFFFEHAGERLFAVAQRPDGDDNDLAVVFCHPYGEEKQFCDRVLVRFAHALAKQGVSTLRFDCRGYGDSEGWIEEATLETQVVDTLAAVELARQTLGAERVVLLGLRLGATVAALAGERAPELAGLILWSPITVGQRYVDELLRKKLFGDLVAGGEGSSKESLLAALETDGYVDIAGVALSRALTEEMRGLDLPARVGDYSNPVLVGAVENRRQSYDVEQAVVDAYRSAGSSCELLVAETRTYWDDRCLSDWYLPETLYARTSEWLSERWPRS